MAVSGGNRNRSCWWIVMKMERGGTRPVADLELVDHGRHSDLISLGKVVQVCQHALVHLRIYLFFPRLAASTEFLPSSSPACEALTRVLQLTGTQSFQHFMRLLAAAEPHVWTGPDAVGENGTQRRRWKPNVRHHHGPIGSINGSIKSTWSQLLLLFHSPFPFVSQFT